MDCLFCASPGPFSTVEHIIPESLGNDDLTLTGHVCDPCQNYFGKEVEQFVLSKSPLAFWRVLLGIETKKGKMPSVNLSQPRREKGVLQSVHPIHDNAVGFTAHDDGSTSVEIDDSQMINDILAGRRTQFRFVFTPKSLHMMGRFLCKVGLELVCMESPSKARGREFDLARLFARYGKFESQLWPIFHYSMGSPQDFRRLRVDADGLCEDVECYAYRLLEVGGKYSVFEFSMGTDHWVVSLNDPYPSPTINEGFPGSPLRLIWYSEEELGTPNRC